MRRNGIFYTLYEYTENKFDKLQLVGLATKDDAIAFIVFNNIARGTSVFIELEFQVGNLRMTPKHMIRPDFTASPITSAKILKSGNFFFAGSL